MRKSQFYCAELSKIFFKVYRSINWKVFWKYKNCYLGEVLEKYLWKDSLRYAKEAFNTTKMQAYRCFTEIFSKILWTFFSGTVLNGCFPIWRWYKSETTFKIKNWCCTNSNFVMEKSLMFHRKVFCDNQRKVDVSWNSISRRQKKINLKGRM